MKYPRPPRLIFGLMKLFYRLLYYRMAWTYDMVAWSVSLGTWKQWVRSVLPYIHGEKVLELGHGPGHLQVELLTAQKVKLRSTRLIAGLDRSPQMGWQARSRLQRLGLTPSLVNGDAKRLPYASSTFDQVVATFPTDYIVAPETVSEIKRVLACGGELVVLPGAWITGKRIQDRLAAGLFRITGQAPPLDMEAVQPPPQLGGMYTRTEWVKLSSSVVMIVIATKDDATNGDTTGLAQV
jgi:ubiquinone/menaquinone biosynthesis C-methylase UbiE